ncbi:hypothetical protein PG993_011074 [Apiospora rasikravindrae]|uniref:Uncharacterized protein n=1 Tax=Apiospora rasikravindrae TaxID=990691 RepID=A0ABR1SD71_9PEZI
MASRYLQGTPESQYGPPRKQLPKRDEEGFWWKQPPYYDASHIAPFCSVDREPPYGPMEGYRSDDAYARELTNLIGDSDDYAIAFARGDDSYLKLMFSRADGRMDCVFRAGETLKKPGVVHSRLEGWRPRFPAEALEFMWYLANRATVEFGQVCNDSPGPRLPRGLLAKLEMAIKAMNGAFEECAKYRLFNKEQGWMYERSYVELWKNQWRFTENAKPAELMDLLVLRPGHDSIPITHAAPPSRGTNGFAQYAPTASATPVIPVAPLAAAAPLTLTAATPVAPTASATVVPPAPSRRRTALPTFSGENKRRRMGTSKISPLAEIFRHSDPERSPVPAAASSSSNNNNNNNNNNDGNSRSDSTEPEAGHSGGGRGCPRHRWQQRGSNTDGQPRAKSSDSEPGQPEAEGRAVSNGQDDQPSRPTKTETERKKAEDLQNDDVGQDASNPCDHCAKASRLKFGTCRVAKDPTNYRSLLCNNCIWSKLGEKGCFTWENPGHSYPQNVIEVMRDCKMKRGQGKAKGKAKGNNPVASGDDENPS